MNLTYLEDVYKISNLSQEISIIIDNTKDCKIKDILQEVAGEWLNEEQAIKKIEEMY